MRRWTAPLFLVAALAAPASAGGHPLVTDPRGDHPVGPGDVVSADLSTTRGTLVVELTLAAAPSTATPYAYAVNFSVGSCRFSAIYYVAPAVTPSFAGCRDAEGGSQSMPEVAASIDDTTITWHVPLGGKVRHGAVARDINARTAPSGLASGGFLDDYGDAAYSHNRYRIGD